MHRFLATFAPGFEGIIESLLLEVLPSATETTVSSGLIFFSWSGSLSDVCSAAFFNNVFLIIHNWNTNTISFDEMVKSSSKGKTLRALMSDVSFMDNETFRVRYSRENQFCSVEKSLMDCAEKNISAQTGLSVDRLNPGVEFWYIIRREGYSFFTLRLTKKPSTEKYLAQGELRPEIVQLIVALAQVTTEDKILLDPFAGYGSIPEQLTLVASHARIYASDLDVARVADLEKRFSQKTIVSVHQGDVAHLSFIESSSIDLVVTDPPWGFWEGDVNSGVTSITLLYEKMLFEFDRILNSRGRAIILTGAKKEFEDAVSRSSSFNQCAHKSGYRTDILVNGKKSAVFILARQG